MIRPFVFALALALPATGAWGDMYDDCKQSADLDIRIRGCTQVIGRGEEETRKNLTAAYYNRGLAYWRKGAFVRAIEDYDKAIALNPNDALAYANRGVAYRKKGEVDRAIADYDMAIALNPNDAAAYFNRGLAYYEKGDEDQAIADFRKVLEIEPSDQDAKEGLKRLGVTP